MDGKEEVLKQLNALKPEILARFKVKEIALFGSFTRGEQREASDIDLLVDFEEGADLFDLVGLGEFLEARLHHRVDVVSKRALREEIRHQVLKEAAIV